MASSKYSAALIGEPGMMVEVIDLLKRADFIIDVIPTRPYFFWQKLNNCSVAKDSSSLINQARAAVHNRYDLISIMDDETLRILHSSSLSEVEKEVLLPVVSLDTSSHIGSKIELSRLLEKCRILTPAYLIANNLDDLASGSERLGYPILVKIDASAGGLGVFECNGMNDVLRLQNNTKLEYPLLIQKKIIGAEFDLSGFFQQGGLVYFTFSRFESVTRKFGPSSLRTYFQHDQTYDDIALELRSIGKSLGIHGFSNITCIQSIGDGKRYFFEVDLRPNIWVNYAKYIGIDPAKLIKKYFQDGFLYEVPDLPNSNFPKEILIPHRYRMGVLDLILNKFSVWQFMNRADIPYLLIRNTYRGFRFFKNSMKKYVFWIAFIILTYLFLVPQKFLIPEAFDWWDKLQHSLAFAILSLLGFLAYSRTHAQILTMVITMVIYGAVIELAQSFTGWRYGEFRDWLADTLGVTIAWIIYHFLQKHIQCLRTDNLHQ